MYLREQQLKKTDIIIKMICILLLHTVHKRYFLQPSSIIVRGHIFKDSVLIWNNLVVRSILQAIVNVLSKHGNHDFA